MSPSIHAFIFASLVHITPCRSRLVTRVLVILHHVVASSARERQSPPYSRMLTPCILVTIPPSSGIVLFGTL